MSETLETIGKYRILRHLATGGMGEVFLARQTGPHGFNKLVVVKRLLAQYARDKAFLEMFLNEARLAAQLHHPNIVQVFDLGEEGGSFFIGMEFVHGASLRTVRQKLGEAKSAVEANMAAYLCAQGLNGLHHAHTLTTEAGASLGIVHRDISPDNLLVGFDGVVKVVDFGIAKATSAASTTTTGTVKGKFAYMAPEYLAGEPIDGRADVYSMGVVLYELLSGARPFRGNSEPALIMSIMRDPPPPLRELAPSVPPALEAIVNRALLKDPAQRYASAQQMAADLERFVAGRISAGQVKAWLTEVLGPEAARRPTAEIPAEPTPPPPQPAPRVDFTVTVERQPGKPGAPAVDPKARTMLAPALEEPPKPQPGATPSPDDGLSASQVRAVGANRSVVFIIAAVVLLAVGLGFALGSTRAGKAQPEPSQAGVVDAGAPELVVVREPDAGSAAPDIVDAVPVPVADPPPSAGPDAGPSDAGSPGKTGPKPEAKTGRVALVVLPWAEVRFGGALLGVTPMEEIELPKGLQTLVLTNPDLGVTKQVKVRVPAGGVARVKVDLMAE